MPDASVTKTSPRFFEAAKQRCYESMGYTVCRRLLAGPHNFFLSQAEEKDDGARSSRWTWAVQEAVSDLDPEQAKKHRREHNRDDRDALVAKYGLRPRPPPRGDDSNDGRDEKSAGVPRQPGEGGWLDTLASADISDLWDALDS